jgi:hypothetical protein
LLAAWRGVQRRQRGIVRQPSPQWRFKHSLTGSVAFVIAERAAGGQPVKPDSERLRPVEGSGGRPVRSALHVGALVLVAIAISAACIAVSWLGATGAIPWGYNDLDHGPVWRQFALLSTCAMSALVLMVAMIDSADSRRILPARYARRLGATLCVLVLAWGLALLWFGMWGEAALGVVTLAAAAIAPALALAGGVTAAGTVGRKWTSLGIGGAVIAVGALATASTFAS